MDTEKHFLVYTLGGRRFASPLEIVERVVRAVAVAALPRAPETVMGVINFKGSVLPVIDIRSRFRLPVRELELSDHFIILSFPSRRLALLAEDTAGHMQISAIDWIPHGDIIQGADFLLGVLRLADGVMLVPDIERILTPQEYNALDVALEEDKKSVEASSSAGT